MLLDQLTDIMNRIAASKTRCVGELWTMRDLSDNGPADGRKLNGKETSLAANKTLVNGFPPGTDGTDRLGTEGQENSTNLTRATSHSDTSVQHPSKDSAVPTAAIHNLDAGQFNSAIDASGAKGSM